jgi:hypothetical protein
VNLSQAHGALREAAWKILPWLVRGVDASSNQFQQDLQLSLGNLYNGFGEVWTLYNSPSTGGFLMTGLIASVPVQDSAQAKAAVNRIRELVKESMPADSDEWTTTWRETTFDGETIHFLNSTGNRSFADVEESSPYSPAFCVTKTHFLIAAHPQALKAHLRFAKTSDTRFSKTAIPQIPGDALAQVYVNTPRIVQTIYPFLPLLLKPAFAEWQADGASIDLSVVPSAKGVLPYVREATATLVRRNDGLFIEQRNTLPVLAGLAVGKRVLNSQAFSGGGRESTAGGSGIQLGAPAGADGVVQAKADQPAGPAKPTVESPVSKAARRSAPAFLRGLIPDVAQPFIPPDAFDKLAEPADPEMAKERAAERQRRIDARNARRAMRRGMAPPPAKSTTPNPPQPNAP